MKSILKACGINKSYDQNKNIFHVLKSINYLFEQGTIYSITGESGSGKSTLLNIISSIDAPTEGNIYFDNMNVNNFLPNEKNKYFNIDIGIIFQEPYLIKELTVLENIMLKGLIARINYNFCKDKAYQLLKKIGLEEKANNFPHTLSVGQQHRIAILRAIFNDPKFLIADEPTANLDQKSKSDISSLLLQYTNEQKMGLIIATHDNYMINLSDKVLKLNDGYLTEN